MKLSALLVFLFISLKAVSQTPCPPNLGFETGSFDKWELFTGRVATNGSMQLTPGVGNHQIFINDGSQEPDPYGGFPVTAPNGSKYSVKMGYNFPGARVDQLVYSLTVPANATSFSVIFNYAIVLQNPSHLEHEQPRFRVRVFNESRNEYLECSSFDFVAGYNQPDFIRSNRADSVFFKPWSSASINLSSYRGENLRLEFTVNDCTRGGHFGYAYFDVMERCNNSITGNVICPGLDKLTLQAPVGFAGYQWYTGDFSRRVGAGNQYTVPSPKAGDSFAVILLPYAYLGCRDTFYTKITSQNQPINLSVTPTVVGCTNLGADLTLPYVTQGSSTNLTYEYFTDSTAITLLRNPEKIMGSGQFYLRATNPAGCVMMRPVTVTISPLPSFQTKEPPVVTYPETVNITTLPSNDQLNYTYWQDSALTRPVPNPLAVEQSGVYYIKGVNANGCGIIRTITVKITPRILVPTAFTPNGDGKNDRFVYLVQGGLKQIHNFKIYNRWGLEVFSSVTPGEAWLGTYKGKPQESGAYVWQLKATDWQNKSVVLKGTVMLIR